MRNSQPFEQLNSKPERKKLTPKQIGGGFLTAIALAGVLGGGGCAAKTPEVKPTTTTEAPAEPAEVIEEVQDDPTEKYVDGLEVYKEMSVESFEKLPREERLKYGQFLIDQTVGRGNYDDIYEQAKAVEAYITPTEVSVDNTGQEIVNNNVYANQIALLQYVEGSLDNPSMKEFDKSDGMKLLSYAYYDVDGDGVYVLNRYRELKEDMTSRSKIAHLDKEMRAVETTSDLIAGINSITGENVRYKDVTYKIEDGSTRFARFVYCEFDSYNREHKATWLLESLSTDSISLENSSYIEIVK